MAKRCFEELKKAFGERFDEKQATGIINDLEAIEDIAKNSEDLRSYRKATFDYFKDRQVLTRSQLKQKTLNTQKTKSRNDFYLNMRAKGVPMAKAIKSKLSRFSFQGEGAGLNADSMARSLHNRYMGILCNALLKEGKESIDGFRSRGMELDIAMELEQLHLKAGQSGISKNTTALKVARAMYATQNAILKDMQDVGIDIHPLEGRFVRQSHDAKKIRGEFENKDEAFAAWRSEILPRLDRSKTFKLGQTAEEVDEFLKGAFDDIINYRNEIADGHGISDELIMVNKKAADQAEKAARSRKLHFKSAKDWYEYNSLYGKDSLSDSFLTDIQKGARTSALVNIFGSNPEAGLNADIKRARNYLIKNGDEKELKAFDEEIDGSRGIRSLYGTITGANEAGLDSTLAKIGNFERARQNILKLCLSTLGSLPDLSSASMITASKTGKNFLQAHADILSSVIGSDPATRSRNALDFAIAVDDMIGDVTSKFGIDPDKPGMVSEIQRKYFKLIGQSQYTARVKSATTMTFARDMAANADKSFAEINPRLQGWFKRYGIGESEWNIMRNSVEEIGERKQISISGVMAKLEAAAGGEKLPPQAEQLRFKMGTMFTEISELGSPTPSARVKNLIVGNTRADDVFGQIYRFMGQFKSFGLTMYDVAFGVANSDPTREITKLRDVLKGRGDWQSTMGLAVSLTAMGYMAESARAIATGKTPPDPTNPDTWKKAMVRGGSMGLLGDFWFSESRKYDGSIFDDIAGPALGEYKKLWTTVQEVPEDLDKMMNGEETKIGKKIAKIIERNAIPNVPLIKPTIEYLFMNQINEALNPGFLEGREQRLNKQGQEYLIPQVNEEAF